MVLGRDLRAGEVKVMIDHLQRSMTQYFSQGKDIAPVKQIVNSECVILTTARTSGVCSTIIKNNIISC